MAIIALNPKQPALEGATVYAVLYRDGVAEGDPIPMGVVDAAGSASGTIPADTAAGTLGFLVYRQLGAEPAPETDWEVAAGAVLTVSAAPANLPAPQGPHSTGIRIGPDPRRSTATRGQANPGG